MMIGAASCVKTCLNHTAESDWLRCRHLDKIPLLYRSRYTQHQFPSSGSAAMRLSTCQ